MELISKLDLSELLNLFRLIGNDQMFALQFGDQKYVMFHRNGLFAVKHINDAFHVKAGQKVIMDGMIDMYNNVYNSKWNLTFADTYNTSDFIVFE